MTVGHSAISKPTNPAARHDVSFAAPAMHATFELQTFADSRLPASSRVTGTWTRTILPNSSIRMLS